MKKSRTAKNDQEQSRNIREAHDNYGSLNFSCKCRREVVNLEHDMEWDVFLIILFLLLSKACDPIELKYLVHFDSAYPSVTNRLSLDCQNLILPGRKLFLQVFVRLVQGR